MKRAIKAAVLLSIGGFVYMLIEFLWRGHSHGAMFLVGGLCFVLVGCINNYISWDMPLTLQMFLGMLIITAVEFAAGLVLNLWLRLSIWDYSNLPLNLLGQICIPYMGLWYLLSLLGIVLDDYCRHWLFGEDKPYYILFGKKLGR